MTRDEILSVGPAPAETEIEIPEWGGTFLLRPMSGELAEEVQLLAEQAIATKNYACLKGLRGRVAVATVCGMDSQPFFRPADAPRLTQHYNAVLTRIWGLVKQLNALEDSEAEAVAKN